MVPSNSTAKNQARWDAERRLGSGLGMAVGTQSSRKRQLRITRNFAYYEKEESSTTPVGGRSFIAHKWKFYAETKISYKSLLGGRLRGAAMKWNKATMDLAANNKGTR